MNIGGGPIAVEMVQGSTRLGIPTTLLQKGPRILPATSRHSSTCWSGTSATRASTCTSTWRPRRSPTTATRRRSTADGEPRTWEADEILVAVGRRPNIEHLGLEELGIQTEAKGVVVDNRGRTERRHDLRLRRHRRPLPLHALRGVREGVRAVRDMFFPGKGKVVASVPWCTFTDPELAHAGLTEAEAHEQYKDGIEVWHQDLVHNDRARANGATTRRR